MARLGLKRAAAVADMVWADLVFTGQAPGLFIVHP
jgi:hypothetical protein